jgi:hypothetical protein
MPSSFTSNPSFLSFSAHKSPSTTPEPSYWPFSNTTVHGFMSWLNNGNTHKSESKANVLIHEWVLSPNFCAGDMAGFDAHHENKKMDKAIAKSNFCSQFMESSVDILVPSGDAGVPPQTYLVPGLLHKKLTSIIEDMFNDSLAHLLHYLPFKPFYQPSLQENPE